MKTCGHCSASMADAANRCSKCGVAFEGEQVGEVFRTVDRAMGPQGGPGRLLAVLVVAVLILTAAVVYITSP